ncbi:MAG TPA: hypothetical protein VK694_03585 [Verrucomicrobiae bacterium]|nr:hypothetical protein [Verrucomicrobiae bacterium]
MFKRLDAWSARLTPPMRGDLRLLAAISSVGSFWVDYATGNTSEFFQLLSLAMLLMAFTCYYMGSVPASQQRFAQIATRSARWVSLFLLLDTIVRLRRLRSGAFDTNVADKTSAIILLVTETIGFVLLFWFSTKNARARRSSKSPDR